MSGKTSANASGRAPSGGDRIRVDITYLQMPSAPQTTAVPPPPGAAIRTLIRPTVPFYRYLYNGVGAPWLWYERRLLDDEALADVIFHPQISIDVLYVDDIPAGFCEFDMRRWPDLEIGYFGLMPDFIGRRIGPYLLDASVRSAWSRGPRRVWLHTCTLDHPKALQTYLNAGFQSYRRESIHIVDPRKSGVMQRGRLP
ncbi:MAG: GNAT family N-acetyltransferase [Gammaproteobacteria bacterium]|nr:GNAT family N-acetyltransferase [Gammaproteobacteria bacterium]